MYMCMTCGSCRNEPCTQLQCTYISYICTHIISLSWHRYVHCTYIHVYTYVHVCSLLVSSYVIHKLACFHIIFSISRFVWVPLDLHTWWLYPVQTCGGWISCSLTCGIIATYDHMTLFSLQINYRL